MTKLAADLKSMTIEDFLLMLTQNLKTGVIKKHWQVWQAIDEEGNGFSPVTMRGIGVDSEANRLLLFPILVQQD